MLSEEHLSIRNTMFVLLSLLDTGYIFIYFLTTDKFRVFWSSCIFSLIRTSEDICNRSNTVNNLRCWKLNCNSLYMLQWHFQSNIIGQVALKMGVISEHKLTFFKWYLISLLKSEINTFQGLEMQIKHKYSVFALGLPCVARCSSVQTHPLCSWPSDRSGQTECSQSGPECVPGFMSAIELQTRENKNKNKKTNQEKNTH